ncbi:MAG: HlyC/CorC family transporter [Ruminococcaceae bacterium]|nr:HlyC/CorC family transporter [Oscillospiraceae bacterium]
METILFHLLLQFVLIALNAVFACAEIALLNVNEVKLSALAAKGDKRAKRVSKLVSVPSKFLATIQVAITFAGFLGSAFAAENFSDKIVLLVMQSGLNLPISPEALDTIAVILITIVLSFFTLVLGELLPKRIAMKKADKLALSLSGPVRFISFTFAPLVWLLTVSTNGLLRLFGINPQDNDEEVTEEEIRLMVDAGSETGAIDEEEKEIIQNVFEFDDITASEIATHRTDISMLSTEDSAEEWATIIHDTRHTFFPVYTDSIDKIVGVLNAKDYFRLDDKSIDNVMENAVKPPYLVPETVTADVLLRNMRKRKEYFAIVMDEYGGTSGIVTLTDLIQCLVGDIEYADEEGAEESQPEIEQIEENKFAVLGGAMISDVEKAIDRELDEHDCDTISGYILSVIGSIPEDGATLTTENDILFIEVTEVKDHRIEKAILTLKEIERSEDEE